MFASLAARQVFLLYAGAAPPWEIGSAALGELALLGVVLGGLAALHGLYRTTRERDRVEDLHWDSMEAVRVMSELAARPGASLEDRLTSVLELGTHRFGLDLGVAWLGQPDDADDPGRVLAVRGPGVAPERQAACVASLESRLRDASRGVRPLLLLDEGGEPATFFGAPVTSAGTPYGALAFVGLSRAHARFTATDKDLLGLMAQWLAGEIDRRDRVAQAAEIDRLARVAAAAGTDRSSEAAAAGPSAGFARRAFRMRRGVDLNRGLLRLEPRLRQRVGTDGTLAFTLAPELPLLARGRLSLPRLVEGLVDAAARLAPTGRIELSTRPPVEGAHEATLQVRVTGPGVDAGALERVFERPADAFDAEAAARAVLPLPAIEQLLRADGGDLSVSIEPERRALFTAWLPVANATAARSRAPRGQVPASQPPG